jgi:ornithine cyclodeaminase/alanine dehydrogenase-like protein (mu-crystallin family)
MNSLNYTKLGDAIRKCFIEADKYKLDKQVPTLEVDGKYVGDFFNITMIEPRGTEPPIFYHTYSPYDVISNQAPGYGVVFQAGKQLLNTEVTQYVKQRAGVMTPLVLKSLGVNDISDKNILLMGTGKIGQCALAALKAFYPNLSKVDFMNGGSDAEAFTAQAQQLQVAIQRVGLDKLENYDVVVCHTSAKQPVLTADMLERIKPGAIITTFASEDFNDVSKEYYDTSKVTVIVDWEPTISEATELKAAVDEGLAQRQDIVMLKDLFSNGPADKNDKNYTIYRSHGTPMQDLAFLQLLLQEAN